MNFDSLVSIIEQTHLHFQQQAVKAVNVSLTVRNWLIGYYIVEFEQSGEDRAQYGTKLLANLAIRCKHIKGLDERSFRNFRLLYRRYPQIQMYITSRSSDLSIRGLLTTETIQDNDNQLNAIRGSMTPESEKSDLTVPVEKLLEKLSYTHIEQLLTVEDELKRTFYELECIKGTWSVRELKRQINSLYFERSGMSLKPELLKEIT